MCTATAPEFVLQEILGNEAVASRIADTKATQEIRVLQVFPPLPTSPPTPPPPPLLSSLPPPPSPGLPLARSVSPFLLLRWQSSVARAPARGLSVPEVL